MVEELTSMSMTCWCAEKEDDSSFIAEKCSVVKSKLPDAIDILVDVKGDCDKLTQPWTRRYSGIGCSVEIMDKTYDADKLNILFGGKCSR